MVRLDITEGDTSVSSSLVVMLTSVHLFPHASTCHRLTKKIGGKATYSAVNVLTPDNIDDLVYAISTNEGAVDIKKLKFVTFFIYVHIKPDHRTLIYDPLKISTSEDLNL